MGSVETPISNTVGFPQSLASENNVINNTISVNLEKQSNEGANKRKRECKIPTINQSFQRKRKACEDDEEVSSENNSETDSCDSSIGSTYQMKNNQQQSHSPKDINQPPIIVSLTASNTFLQVKAIINKSDLDVKYKCNGKYVSISTTSAEDHTKIINILSNIKADFHTYSRKNEIKP